MQCLECQREVRNINYRHLMSCSGITPREYLERHPGAQLVDADVRASYGLPLERNPKWRGGRSYRNCSQCGQRLHRRNKSGNCHHCQTSLRSGDRNHFYGREHSADTRARMAEAAKHRDKSTYRGGGLSSERLSAMRREYWSKIPLDERAGRLATFIEAGQRHNKRSSQTQVENLVAAMLDELGVSYYRNVFIGRYNVDFLLGKLIIVECFGDYWHCHPEMYEPQSYHRSLHVTASEKWQRDRIRQEWLEAQGYSAHIVWERDAKQDRASTLKRLELITSSLRG